MIRAVGKLVVVFALWLFVVALSPATAQTDAGLAGAPIRADTFRTIDKYGTICPKCRAEQTAFHAAVDRYDAQRAEYDRLAEEVRQAADRFVRQRDEVKRLEQALADADAFWDEMRAEDAYLRDDYVPTEEAARRAIAAIDPYYDAKDALPGVRAELQAAFDALEAQRLVTVEAMGAALAAERAMFRCETQCEISELDLDERDPPPPPPEDPALIDASQVPQPENFVGIVAACAECLPLSERVNQIRSHRRSFAVDASTTYDSMVNNQRTLERVTRELAALDAQERTLYRNMAEWFKGAEPSEGSDPIDFILDEVDQRETADMLRQIAARRAQLQGDMAGLAQTIQTQFRGLLEAIANYHAHTALLEAAQKALEDCEKNCPPPPPDPADDPFTDPNYPMQDNIDPLVAKCWECQPLADALIKSLVERRSVAGDIQSVVWLIKSRRAEIERKDARLDELRAEERQMGEALRIGLDANADVSRVLSELWDIENEQTQLLQDVLAAEQEIPQYEADLAVLMARHEALSRLIEEQQAALDICEYNKCQPENGEPRISLTPPLTDPAYPIPQPFTYVATDCLSCQPIVDQINAKLLDRYVLAGRIQATAAELTRLGETLTAKQAELEAAGRELGERGMEYHGAEGDAARAAALVALDAVIDRERALQDEITGLEDLIRGKRQVLARMQTRYSQIEGEILTLSNRLAECERNCADPDEPEEDIFLAGQDPFVTTDCEPCLVLASRVNDAVGSLIGAQRDLAAAKKAEADLVEQAKTRRDRLAEIDEALNGLSEIWLTTYEKPGREAEFREADDAMTELDREKSDLETEQGGEDEAAQAARDAVDAAQRRVDDLHVLITNLKAELAECEKQCQPPDEDIALDESPFVATDCPPCQTLASMLNDVIGSQISLKRQVAEGEAELERLRGQTATLESAVGDAREALDAINDALIDPANADQARDLAFDSLDAEGDVMDARNAVRDNAFAIEALVQKIAGLKAQIAMYEAQEPGLRAQLAECEQQCQPPEEGTETALPETPFVNTDCEKCLVLASMVNDAVGSRIGAERRLEDARAARAAEAAASEERQAKIAELRAKLHDNRQARLNASDMEEYEPLFDEGEALGDELLPLLFEEEDTPGKLEQMDADIAALEAEIARLVQQEADLKAQLAECERTCNDPDETAMGDEAPNPFVTTDCERCLTLASMVNDAVGTHIGAERAAQEIRDRMAGIRDEIAEKEAVRDGDGDEADKLFIDDEISILETDLEFAGFDLEKAEDRVADLARQVAALKAQLAECEQNCDPGATPEETATAPEPEPRFARTDCEPCAQIVATLNDVIGSRIGAEERLERAQSEYDRIKAADDRVQAAIDAAEEAFTQAAVEKARLERSGQDASAQQAALDANLDRAADLSFEADDLFMALQEAEDALNEAKAALERLQADEARLRAALAECERQCGGSETAGMVPDVLLDKLQDAGCRAGGACTFTLGVTNQSDGPHRGPLFLSETGRVDAGANGALFDGWHCSPAAGANSICLREGEIGAGEKVGLSIPVRLPGYVAPGSENCIRVEFAVDPRKLLQLIQVGLAARGLNPGVADGLMGPRTRAAIVALGEASGQEVDPGDLEAVYRLMFGTNPSPASASDQSACIEMEVENPPRTATPRPPAQNVTSSTPGQSTPQGTPQGTPRPQVQIGIGLGFEQPRAPTEQELETGGARPGGLSIGGIGLGLSFGD
ncbi:MAG: hypothetical protein HOY44_03675 [Maritimibacter sp.]|uniref:hypothetical protein n=1 Tax=Maritimibacter sp. TaxID=2003363 RepID=UPI001E0FCAD6|nr:hypothetical protein [Maritimibacter sp.]MBL6426602.1 hypothetical protein [Maritimibacter sp.]